MKINDKVYWTKANGDLIDIDEMSENHLRNTLKMIVRKADAAEFVYNEQILSKAKQVKLKGDMANEFNNSNEDEGCDELDYYL